MVRPMTKAWVRMAALAAAPLALLGCGAKPVEDAAGPVRSLLTAAQAGDAGAFEALVDRSAVRADLRKQLAPVARANEVLVDGGPSDLALDHMISPAAFRLVQRDSGAPLAGPPSKAQVEAMLKRVDDRRVCVHDQTPAQQCVATFAKERPGWRLIGMLAGGVTVAAPPEPAK